MADIHAEAISERGAHLPRGRAPAAPAPRLALFATKREFLVAEMEGKRETGGGQIFHPPSSSLNLNLVHPDHGVESHPAAALNQIHTEILSDDSVIITPS